MDIHHLFYFFIFLFGGFESWIIYMQKGYPWKPNKFIFLLHSQVYNVFMKIMKARLLLMPTIIYILKVSYPRMDLYPIF